jgi:transcription elongation factor Elf1
MTAPLPCPFCGSTNVCVISASTFRWKLITCADCGARGPEVCAEADDDEWELSVTAWNHRV